MSQFKSLTTLIYILLFLPFCLQGLADEVYLKNGNILKGIIKKKTDEYLVLQLMIGETTLNLDQIKEVRKASSEENQQLKDYWQNLIKSEERKFKVEAKRKRFKGQLTQEIKTIFQKETGRVYTKGGHIYVDNKLFFVKGVVYEINYPGVAAGMVGYYRIPPEIFERDFEMMAKAGINCIRTYEPLPLKLLDLAEKHGIMVIENIIHPSNWTNYNYKSDKELKSLIAEAIRIVKRDKDRRCILMWSIWSDTPFLQESQGSNMVKRYGLETVREFLKEIYLAVKAEDKQHPITGSNILDQKDTEVGFDFLDVIGVNAYLGEDGQWLGIEKARETIKQLVEISKKHNKPVVILETGCSTYYMSEEVQYEILKKQIEITNQHIAGLVIFQWTDGWWRIGEPGVHNDCMEEHWGILTGYREPKTGYKAVSEMFNKIDINSTGYTF